MPLGLIVVLLVFVGTFILFYKSWGGDIFFSLTHSFIVGILTLFFGCALGDFLPKSSELSGKDELVAFSDGRSVEGPFFLGSGYVQETPYYFFYRKTSDGGIVQGSVPAVNSVLYEEADDVAGAHMKTLAWRTRSDWALWFSSGRVRYSYQIYVPKGTVVRQFVVDLKR